MSRSKSVVHTARWTVSVTTDSRRNNHLQRERQCASTRTTTQELLSERGRLHGVRQHSGPTCITDPGGVAPSKLDHGQADRGQRPFQRISERRPFEQADTGCCDDHKALAERKAAISSRDRSIQGKGRIGMHRRIPPLKVDCETALHREVAHATRHRSHATDTVNTCVANASTLVPSTAACAAAGTAIVRRCAPSLGARDHRVDCSVAPAS